MTSVRRRSFAVRARHEKQIMSCSEQLTRGKGGWVSTKILPFPALAGRAFRCNLLAKDFHFNP